MYYVLTIYHRATRMICMQKTIKSVNITVVAEMVWYNALYIFTSITIMTGTGYYTSSDKFYCDLYLIVFECSRLER